MIAPYTLIEQARLWIGVRYLHQGRSRIGCDCLGFVGALLAELGSPLGLSVLPLNYSRAPKARMMQTLDANCRQIPLQAGALLAIQFPFSQWPSHAAIYTGATLIHAYASVGRVVETNYQAPWVARTRSVWALPLVTYQ